MRRLILLFLLMVVAGCGGGGSLAAPSGAVMTITPASKEGAPIKITSSSALQKSIVQLYQLSVKDSSAAGAKGVRDTIFDVTFELSNVPGTGTADLASLVTMCDGSAIINTTAEKQTDNQGIYNLCIVFKVGGGLNYTGNLRVLSGASSASTTIDVASTLSGLTVSPDSAMTIPPGSRGQFTITGGLPEYTITSSSVSILPVPSVVTSSGGTFMVAIPLGTAETSIFFTVRDAAGTIKIATVNVGPPAKPTVLPAAATVVAGGTVKFTILGGVPDYTVFSDNTSVIPVPTTVTANGGTFSVTVPANASDNQTFTLTVRDSIGVISDPVKITAKAPPALKIIPANMTIVAGNTATFAITGGVPGYTVVSDNASVFPSPSHVADSGDTFQVSTSSNLKINFTITAIDSIGQPVSVTVNITPVKSNQRISFGTAPSIIVGGTGIVSATATSGLPVTFTSFTPSVCTISGAIVTGVSAGTCIIAGDQAGNSDYNAAPQATLTINVIKSSQTITFGATPSVSVGGTGTVSATSSSGLPVTFTSLTTSVCTISGATVTGVTAGQCRIAADQSGNPNYNAAPQVVLTMTILP